MRRFNTIFATGALAKFLDARERGASRDELMRLSNEAMKERAIAKDAAQSSVVVDLELARRAREWESAPGY
jgi:hypothetical protein